MTLDQIPLEKLFKFAVVGFSAFVIDFGTTYLIKEKLKANKYLANTIAFIVSASYNFMLNRMWTWRSMDDQIALQAFKFALVMVTGLLIASGIIYILSDRAKLNFYISKLIAVSVVMVWNFTMNNLVTFSH